MPIVIGYILVDVSANEDEFGFFSSGVDPYSRKTYEVLFAYPRNMTLMQNLTDTLEDFSKRLNYNLSTTTGDGDIDVYLQNIEVYASRGIDGIITNIDPATSQRIIEVLNETGAQWMDILNSDRDENGSNLVPCATLDGYAAGQSEIQWLYDLDGKATHETLWSRKRAPGDKATLYFIKNEIVTVDTYKEYFDRIEKQLEAHTQ